MIQIQQLLDKPNSPLVNRQIQQMLAKNECPPGNVLKILKTKNRADLILYVVTQK